MNNKKLALLPAAAFAWIVCFMAHSAEIEKAEQPQADAPKPKCVILGFDGLDPNLTEKWIAEGKLPAFAALAEQGGLHRLATSTPPISPVAWSNLCLGVNPGSHGIFGFLKRHPRRYASKGAVVDFPTGRVDPQTGAFVSARPLAFRRGKPFWTELDEANVRTAIFQCPLTFPPDSLEHGRMLSGLTTPDLRLNLTPYVYYTNNEAVADRPSGSPPPRLLRFEDYAAESLIPGPWREELRAMWDEFEGQRTEALERMARAEPGEEKAIRSRLQEISANQSMLAARRFVSIPFRVERIGFDIGLTVLVQGQRQNVRPGQWSELFELEFDMGAEKIERGLCRFYLAGTPGEPLGNDVDLICTAPDMHPEAPLFPISCPDELAGDLAGRVGLFETRGWPWPTQALLEGRIGDEAFWANLRQILDQREKMFFDLYEGGDWDLFFGVFSETDIVSHLFWRTMDPKHPAYTDQSASEHGGAIEEIYLRMDAILGRVIEGLPDDALLLVVSDHGFAPFYTQVNLNNIFLQNGLLSLKDPRRRPETVRAFGGVDWKKTRAYALGFGQIFLNLAGREPAGIVEPGDEADSVKREISELLLSLLDPISAEPVVEMVFETDRIYQGARVAAGPDLVVGFHRGYRVDWRTPQGSLARRAIEPNQGPWSGDHSSMSPESVPGALLMNRPPGRADIGLLDIAPAVLSHFAVAVPDEYEGSAF